MFIFRFLSSIVLVSLFLAAVFWKSIYGFMIFAFMAQVLVFMAVKELQDMLTNIGRFSYKIYTPLVALLVVDTLFLAYVKGIIVPYNSMLVILFVLIGWVTLLFSGNKREVLDKVLNSTAALFFIVLPLSYIIHIYMIGENISGGESTYIGRNLILFLVLVTKIGDIGAYVTGTLSNKITKGGNHKIVPTISPKKSWEGTIGGFTCSLILAYLLSDMLPDLQYEFMNKKLIALAFGAVLFVGGFSGDLAESSLKRICCIKDSGKVIPGIGGVFDLVDSLVLNAPVFFFALNYLFKIN